MLIVLVAVAAIWIIGMAMGTPTSMRWTMLAGLYFVVLSIHLIFPDGHPLRMATGETSAPWMLLGALALIIIGYRSMLGRLRNMAPEDEQAESTKPTFSESELNRYARHIIMREIGGPGQKKLKEAKVLVIGAGGLGSPAMMYLAAAGVGTIGVIDDDRVDSSNLQRQVIHRDEDIGLAKVHSAEQALKAQNPFVKIHPYRRRLTKEIAAELIGEYDLVLDGSDNFETRYLVDETCFALKKPLVSGAMSQWEGQVSVFDAAHGGPCYRCVFPEAPAAGLSPSCAEAGVAGPLPGVIGSLMALEALKLITGAGEVLRGEMLIYDGLYAETRKVTLKKREDCATCRG